MRDMAAGSRRHIIWAPIFSLSDKCNHVIFLFIFRINDSSVFHVTLRTWIDFKEPLVLRQSRSFLSFMWVQEMCSKPKFSNLTEAKTCKLCEKNMGMSAQFLT